MEKTITIKITWWNDEDKVNDRHLDELEKHAEARIFEMRKDDYTSGELNYEIEGVHYNGWWEFSY